MSPVDRHHDDSASIMVLQHPMATLAVDFHKARPLQFAQHLMSFHWPKLAAHTPPPAIAASTSGTRKKVPSRSPTLRGSS